jgi:hypothetical protein
MKANLLFTVALLLIAILIASIVGCKDDVTEPYWPKPDTTNKNVTTPAILSVDPPAAIAGVNIIRINGQSFGDSLSEMDVYFNSTVAEKLSGSDSLIVVRRPNIVDPAALLKFRTPRAYIAINVSYRVDQVFQKYGSFLENITLGSICGNGDTLYALQQFAPFYWFRINPDGNQSFDTITGVARTAPTDARIRNGVLYWMRANLNISRIDLSTKVCSNWVRITGRTIRYGDFGPNNNFYCGGNATDLCVFTCPPTPQTIFPDTITAGEVTLAGAYASENILAIRVFNGYVYVASRVGTNPCKIYRHLIGSGNSIGSRGTAVLDFAGTQFSSRLIKSLTFSASGTIFIQTEAPNPLLVYDGATLDYFYKDILNHIVGVSNSYWIGKQAYWHNSNYMYLIANDTLRASDAADKWNVLQVNMGTPGSTPFN